jgi:SAM-dependent methyltransferase
MTRPAGASNADDAQLQAWPRSWTRSVRWWRLVSAPASSRSACELGFTVVGVDLSPAMAQRARRRLGPVVAVADAAQLPVADAAIQQAVSVWLLHLVADRAAVLAEVARALRPGGRYLVSLAWLRVPPRDEVERLLFDMRNQLDPTEGGATTSARSWTPPIPLASRSSTSGPARRTRLRSPQRRSLTASRRRPGRACGTSPTSNGERWSRPPLRPFERSPTPTSNADTTFPSGSSCCNDDELPRRLRRLATRQVVAEDGPRHHPSWTHMPRLRGFDLRRSRRPAGA